MLIRPRLRTSRFFATASVGSLLTALAPLIAWITFMLLLDLALASPHFPENGMLLEGGNGLQVVSSTPHEIALSLQVPTIAVDTVTLAGNPYHTIQIQGWSSTEGPGLPKLPFYSCIVAIPECRNVKVVAAVTDSQVAYGYNVCPAERSLMKVDPDGIPFQEHVFEIDHSAYASDQFYPSRVCEIVDVFYLRDQKVGRLNIYPVRFNPAREQLAVYSKIDIKVRPQSPSGPTSTPVGPYETIAERLLVGYQAGGGSTRPELLSTSPPDGVKSFFPCKISRA